jgi:hypothetical protein
MSICTHINKILKSNAQLQLPLPKLIQAWSSNDEAQKPLMVQNFILIYLEMGLKRVATSGGGEGDLFKLCLPNLLKDVSKKTSSQQETLFALLLLVFLFI